MNFQELLQKMSELDQPVQEEKKADKDYDGDGEVESEKDEVWGSRMKAAKDKQQTEGRGYRDPDWDYEQQRQREIDYPERHAPVPKYEPSQDEIDAEREENARKKAELDKVMSWMFPKKKNEGVDSEEIVDECGMMGPMDAPKQQDSVTMSVNMNGSGTGGIRDLLNVLKDIQDGPSASEPEMDLDIDSDRESEPASDDDMLMLKKLSGMGSMIDDDFGNSAPGDEGPEIMPMPDVGNDLHKEKGAYPKASGGDNAIKLGSEQTFKLPKGDLKIRLENLYNEIKSR